MVLSVSVGILKLLSLLQLILHREVALFRGRAGAESVQFGALLDVPIIAQSCDKSGIFGQLPPFACQNDLHRLLYYLGDTFNQRACRPNPL